MENIICSCCDYIFTVDEIYYDRFYVCKNPNCYKILCSDCNDLNNVFLNEFTFDIDCNCGDINDDMSISTSSLIWNESDEIDDSVTVKTCPLTDDEEEKKDDDDFINYMIADF